MTHTLRAPQAGKAMSPQAWGAWFQNSNWWSKTFVASEITGELTRR
jgi:hypothetical protein